MLCLQARTNDGWIEVASRNINAVLIDHAHCERKAALNGMNMIMRYPERNELVREMITLIEEETAHFKLIFGELAARGISLSRDRGNPYAKELSAHIRKSEPERMLDSLLVDCLIEARSCERFTLLARAESIAEDLRGIYHSLMASEEGHYLTFVELAAIYFPKETVARRLDELAAAEAAIVRALRNEPRMHG